MVTSFSYAGLPLKYEVLEKIMDAGIGGLKTNNIEDYTHDMIDPNTKNLDVYIRRDNT